MPAADTQRAGQVGILLLDGPAVPGALAPIESPLLARAAQDAVLEDRLGDAAAAIEAGSDAPTAPAPAR